MKKLVLLLLLLLVPALTHAQSFPTNSTSLDDFNRADGDITTGSNWVVWPFFNSNLDVLSNQIWSQTATKGNLYAISHGPDIEYFVTVAVLPPDGSNFEMAFRHDSNTSVDTWYGLTITKVAGSNNDTWRLFKFVAGSFTEIVAQTSMGIDIATNDVVGLRMVGSAFNVYVNGVSRGSTTDGSITNAGYGGLMINNTTARLDNFGGGTFIPGTRRQPILGIGFRGIIQ